MKKLSTTEGVLEWAEDFSHRSPHWQSPGSIETAAYLAECVRLRKKVEAEARREAFGERPHPQIMQMILGETAAESEDSK